jgi:hypothetical protein
MPGFMDRLQKITGSGTPEDAANPQKESPRESGVFEKTEFSPGAQSKEEFIKAKWSAAKEEQAKLDEMRQRIADQQAAASLKEVYGGKKQFMKEAQKSADVLRLNLQREKASEEQRIQEQNAASIKDLQSKATRIGIDKDLELWEKKQAEEKARRERLDLE